MNALLMQQTVQQTEPSECPLPVAVAGSCRRSCPCRSRRLVTVGNRAYSPRSNSWVVRRSDARLLSSPQYIWSRSDTILLLSKLLEEPREQRSSRSSLTRSFAGEGSSRKRPCSSTPRSSSSPRLVAVNKMTALPCASSAMWVAEDQLLIF